MAKSQGLRRNGWPKFIHGIRVVFPSFQFYLPKNIGGIQRLAAITLAAGKEDEHAAACGHSEPIANHEYSPNADGESIPK
ncbi:MAG: hypothetical protein HS116_00450 [Planctomycetes bacterium]|nr:hypothetical protein [Planctomycetota bacterium]